MAQFSLLLLSFALATLAFYVWHAKPSKDVNRWFAAQTLLLACWVLGIAGLQSGTNLTFWGRFTFASAALIPAAFLMFTRCYPTQSTWPSGVTTASAVVAGILIGFSSLATPLVVSKTYLTENGLAREPGALYPVFSFYFLATWLIAFTVFVRKWRLARGLERARLQYLGAGIVASAAGGIGTNLVLPLISGRSTYSWLGPYFSVVFVALVAHAVIRHRLLDLRLVVNRTLAYAISTVLLSLVSLLGIRLFVPHWHEMSVLQFDLDLLVIIAVGLLVLSSPAQRLLRSLIDPYLYRGRHDYASALRDATYRLSRLMQPKDLAGELQDILRNVFVPELSGMIARSSPDGPLENLSTVSLSSLDVSALEHLVQGEQLPAVLVVSALRDSDPEVVDQLQNAGAEILLALGRRNQVLGIVLVGTRRSGDAYFTQDLSFLESLSSLASIALDNALLYRHRIQMLEYSERLLESLNSAVVAIDIRGTITNFNPAARALFGLSSYTLGADLTVLPTEVGWALALAISGDWYPRETELTIDHPERLALPVILSAAVLRDSERNIVGALTVVTDLTAVKELERNRQRIEHFTTMTRFYAGIAHEIRSPLTAISNFVAMLPDRLDDPEYRETAGRLLPLEVARIVRLADRLRLMAPSEDGRLSVIRIPPLLSDIVAIHAPAAAEHDVRVALDCPKDLPDILGDPAQLVQLLVNLLRNAIESMSNGGTVTIQARYHRARRDPNQISVRVIDEGCGIDPAIRNKIFQPFFTTKPTGTGLGLSICKEIADFHHARLELHPRSGGSGTVAEVQFASISRASKTSAPTSAEEASHRA